MKPRVILIVLSLVFLLAASASSVGQTSAADKTFATGTETFDPFGLFGPPVGTIISPGTVACPGSQPTGNPMQPCPVGSRMHVRHFKVLSRVDSSDPRLSGWMTVDMNANFDEQATGPAWGTYSLAVNEGGTIDGTFEGVRSFDGSQWVIPLHASGQGVGGVVDGLQLVLVDRILGYTPVPIAYFGTIEGRILDPHSK